MGAFLKRSAEDHNLRKGELEELLEEDQRGLEAELNELARRVEIIAENHVAGEFRKNNERLAAIRRELEDKQARGEELEEREKLLGAPSSFVLKTVTNIREIGRASCRARVCQYVSISVVAVSLKKKKHKQ